MRRLWLILFVLLASPSCATPDNVQPPSIDIAGFRLESAVLLSQEFALDIKLGNPNDLAIPLTGLAFKLGVNGRPFAEGLSNHSVTVPRIAYANTQVTGTTNTLSLLRQIVTVGIKDKIDYRLFGTARVGRLGQNYSVPYDKKSSLSLLPAALGNSQASAGIRMFAPSPR